MSVENNVQSVSIPASADLSASQYCFMKIDTNGQLAVSGDGGVIAGILQDKPTAAAAGGMLGIGGISKVRAGGTCTKGSFAASDPTGRAVDAISGDMAGGIFISGTTVANDVVELLVMPQLGKVW